MSHNVAFAYMTKDRVELTQQTWPRVFEAKGFDAYWLDGSKTNEGQNLGRNYGRFVPGIGGGADRAIVYALSTLLAKKYDYVGLLENDVLLQPDWFGPTFELFKRGESDGLKVGAVSARSYEDRVLALRDGYALMHNTGAGMVLFSAEAARLILANYRTAYTMENRFIFAKLCGIDIGHYWAFRGGSHWLTVDWGFDACLARHGLASLALVPTAAHMLENIAEQGLAYADNAPDFFRNDAAFDRFVERSQLLRDRKWDINQPDVPFVEGEWWYMPQQLGRLYGEYDANWRVKWAQGFGPFYYSAAFEGAEFKFRVFGPFKVLVDCGKFKIDDRPVDADANLMAFTVPYGCEYRQVTITALTKGANFRGLVCQEHQPHHPAWSFSFKSLPEVED